MTLESILGCRKDRERTEETGQCSEMTQTPPAERDRQASLEAGSATYNTQTQT